MLKATFAVREALSSLGISEKRKFSSCGQMVASKQQLRLRSAASCFLDVRERSGHAKP